MQDRFIGEAVITFSDQSKQVRRVLILSPYVQTSENLRDIDYDHSLVVDLQTMEFDFKSQLEEMVMNPELRSYHTFMDYATKTVFRNGENVLQWLHRMRQISKVPASDVSVVIGQGGYQQKIAVVDINNEIRKENEKKIEYQNTISSTYSDASMNEQNIQPAAIERTGNQHKDASQPLNESAEASVTENVVSNQDAPMPSDAVDLSKVPGVTVLEGGEYHPEADGSNTQEGSQEAVQTPLEGYGVTDEGSEMPDTQEIVNRIESLEKAVKSKTKDSFITRMMNRYDLTESEATKALETAGKRKQRKAEKEREKADDKK